MSSAVMFATPEPEQVHVAIYPVRFDHLMREGNVWDDRLVEGIEHPSFVKRNALLAQWTRGLDAKVAGKGHFRRTLSSDWALAMFLPGLDMDVRAG